MPRRKYQKRPVHEILSELTMAELDMMMHDISCDMTKVHYSERRRELLRKALERVALHYRGRQFRISSMIQ